MHNFQCVIKIRHTHTQQPAWTNKKQTSRREKKIGQKKTRNLHKFLLKIERKYDLTVFWLDFWQENNMRRLKLLSVSVHISSSFVYFWVICENISNFLVFFFPLVGCVLFVVFFFFFFNLNCLFSSLCLLFSFMAIFYGGPNMIYNLFFFLSIVKLFLS